MSKYNLAVDPRAAATRRHYQMQSIRNMSQGVAKWALHLSEEEVAYLEQHNPETLGNYTTSKIHDEEWAKFIKSPESQPYRVQRI